MVGVVGLDGLVGVVWVVLAKLVVRVVKIMIMMIMMTKYNTKRLVIKNSSKSALCAYLCCARMETGMSEVFQCKVTAL